MSYTPNQISETSAIGVNSDTVISGGNWSADTYTGTFELNDYAYVGVNLQVDETGTLFFDFSQDGVNFSSYPVAGVSIASGINEVHTAWKGGRYFRVRFVGTGGRSFFRLKTFFSHHPLPLSAPLNQGIGSDQDATVVRSVGIGENPAGSYVNEKTDGISFTTQTNLTAATSLVYDSGILDSRGFTQLQTHVSASHDGTMEFIFFTDAGGTDEIRRLTIAYVAANGFELFSAPCFSDYVQYKFTNDSGSDQTDFHYETKFLTKALSGQVLALKAPIVGGMVANVGRSVIVGEDPAGSYRNVPTDTEGHLKVNIHDPKTAFGDLRVAELTPQVELTFPYNINNDIVDTATISGSVTQSGSMAVLQSSAVTSGEAEISSRKVLTYRAGLGAMTRFTSQFTSGVANSYQYIGIGDEADGFFFGYSGASFGILRRKDSVDEWIPQTSWNVDIMDGNNGATNPSNMNMDKTKINVFQIQYQWLGAGQIEFDVEDEDTGLFVPVHRIKYANKNTQPSIFNANLPLHAHVVNDGNNTNLTLKTASMAGFCEGKSIPLGPTNNYNASKSISTEEHLYHLRNKITINSITNRVRMILKHISAGNDANALSTVRVYSNATLAGTPTWTNINGDDSCVEVDTVQTYSSGGRLLFQGVVGKDSGQTFDLENLDIQIVPGEIITITAEAGQAGNQSVALTWQEDY